MGRITTRYRTRMSVAIYRMLRPRSRRAVFVTVPSLTMLMGTSFFRRILCYSLLYMKYGMMLTRPSTRCSNCEKLHGGQEGVNWFPPSYIKSMSSAYCAETQTLGIDEFLGNYTESTSLPASLQTSMSDVLGNKTDVSLYWTASATDAKATGASETGTSASGTGATGSATGSASGATSTGGAGAVGVEGVLTGLCVGVVMGFACLL